MWAACAAARHGTAGRHPAADSVGGAGCPKGGSQHGSQGGAAPPAAAAGSHHPAAPQQYVVPVYFFTQCSCTHGLGA